MWKGEYEVFELVNTSTWIFFFFYVWCRMFLSEILCTEGGPSKTYELM